MFRSGKHQQPGGHHAGTTTQGNPAKISVGGAEVTPEEIVTAIETLVVANGIMIKAYLNKAGSPLAAYDYHAVANGERQIAGEQMQTKKAFIATLRRVAPE